MKALPDVWVLLTYNKPIGGENNSLRNKKITLPVAMDWKGCNLHFI